MLGLELAQKILEKITNYHNQNHARAVAAAEISHIVKDTYEEMLKKEQPKAEENTEIESK